VAISAYLRYLFHGPKHDGAQPLGTAVPDHVDTGRPELSTKIFGTHNQCSS